MFANYIPHVRVTFDCGDEVITKQSHKSECDINTILKIYTKTGIISHISSQTAEYMDLPPQMDFQQSLDVVHAAEAAFATLPSKVRDRYSNSPSLFLSALSDPSQREYLTEMGIFRAPAVVTPGQQPPVARGVSPSPASPSGEGVL